MTARGRMAVVALIGLVAWSRAAANPAPAPHLHVLGDSELRYACTPGTPITDPTRCLTRVLPPVHILDEPSWDKLDTEIKRLQAAETRLTAENVHMRDATSGWQPGWRTLAITLVTGFASGVVAYHYLK